MKDLLNTFSITAFLTFIFTSLIASAYVSISVLMLVYISIAMGCFSVVYQLVEESKSINIKK